MRLVRNGLEGGKMQKAVLFLVLMLLPIIVACGGANPIEVQQKFNAALSKGDVAGALAFFSDDGVFEALGCPEGGCKGKSAVKGAIEGVVAQHGRFTILSSKASGDTATSRMEAELDVIKAAGVQRIIVIATLEMRDGKMVLMRPLPDASDPQTAKFLEFLQKQTQPAR